MKRFIAVFAVLVMAGCANVTDFHNACQSGNAAFADQVACVKANINEHGGYANDTYLQEYVMTGEELARQVHAGRISEDQARLQWVEKLNDIRQAQLTETAAQNSINRSWDWPHYTDCHRSGEHIFCDTW
jgi:hypothetical protein